jgi:O-antigen/teichoic acid export membrane protein
MGRAWRQQAGTLLIIFMVLAAVTTVYGIIRNAGQHIISGILLWLVVYSHLAWRIWRHRSSRARDALLVLSALGVLGLIRVAFRWSPDLLVASGLCAAQFVLLLSPAVRRHVQAKPSGSRPSND